MFKVLEILLYLFLQKWQHKPNVFYKHQTQAQQTQTQQVTSEQQLVRFLFSALTLVSAAETLAPLFPSQIVTLFYITLTALVTSFISKSFSNSFNVNHVHHEVFPHQYTTASLVKTSR